MALDAPIFWRSKILLAKIEATYGTDPVPAAATNGILATNVLLSPMEGTDVSRALDLPYLGAQPTIPTDLHRKITFEVELAPSGTAGTAPLWGPLLRACAVAETIAAGVSVTYNPITTAQESVTLYFWLGSTLFKLSGARGTCTIEVGASGIPKLKFEFTGLYSDASETAPTLPTLAGFEKPLLASMAHTPVFTIAGTALKMKSYSHAFGNQVTPRFLIGAEEVLIMERADALDVTIDAVPLTTLDPFTLAKAQTTVAIALTHGITAGSIASLAIPAAQMQRPASIVNDSGVTQWQLKLVPLPTAGNDQWSITLT